MKSLVCALIISVALSLSAQTSSVPANQDPSSGSSSIGLDFDKLKTELHKQKEGQEAAEGKNQKKDTPSMGIVGLKLIIYLLIIIIFFFIITRVIKGGSRKIFPAKFLRSLKPKARTMEVLDTLNLGQGRLLNMVRVHNQVLVLGLSQHRIEPLLTIGDGKAVKNIMEILELPPSPVMNFAQEVDYHLETLQKQGK
jgi:flagellar biogenesis protein FliO